MLARLASLGRARARRLSTRIATAAALVALLLPPSAPAGADGSLSVVHEPPRLWIEARDVSLPDLLRAIGGKVGFAVDDLGGSAAPQSWSLEGLPLAEVLRWLLRTENHAVLHREEGPGSGLTIDRVILLGERARDPAPAVAAALAGEPGGHGPARADGPAGPSARAGQGDEAPSMALEVARPDQSVPELLRTWAFSGMPAPSSGPDRGRSARGLAQAGSGGAAGDREHDPHPATPDELERMLAITTSLAQAQLRALIDGLARATQGLTPAGSER